MSYNTPDPSGGPHRVPQASFVQIDGMTGLPVGHPDSAPAKVTGDIAVTPQVAASATNNAAVTVGATSTSLATANANRIGMRIRNIGPDTLAISATSITWATRVITLEKDEVWLETEAANLAWVGICDAAKSASVTVQEIFK
jgi:hypothetical protein